MWLGYLQVPSKKLYLVPCTLSPALKPAHPSLTSSNQFVLFNVQLAYDFLQDPVQLT